MSTGGVPLFRASLDWRWPGHSIREALAWKTTAWFKRLGIIALGVGLGGCGAAASVRTGQPGPSTTHIRVQVASAGGQISAPGRLTSAGTTTLSLGSETGYILNATHNAVIWQQGRWRFQVVGPFVASQPQEAVLLQHTFQHTAMPGAGVVSLTETHHLWQVAISWEHASKTIWDARWAIPGNNTDIIRAVLLQVAGRAQTRPGALACRATLRAVDGETAISDVVKCAPSIRQ